MISVIIFLSFIIGKSKIKIVSYIKLNFYSIVLGFCPGISAQCSAPQKLYTCSDVIEIIPTEFYIDRCRSQTRDYWYGYTSYICSKGSLIKTEINAKLCKSFSFQVKYKFFQDKETKH